MREITVAQAINEALAEEMERNPEVFVIGEDVGKFGGCFGVTAGLIQRFPKQVIDSPAILSSLGTTAPTQSMATWGGLMIAVATSIFIFPTLVTVKVPPTMSSTARAPFLAFSVSSRVTAIISFTVSESAFLMTGVMSPFGMATAILTLISS